LLFASAAARSPESTTRRNHIWQFCLRCHVGYISMRLTRGMPNTAAASLRAALVTE
jgi:hypothetical protein